MSNPTQVQNEIVDEFSLFPEWLDRYQYLIDLGRKLPPLPEESKIDANLLEGCQSSVWLIIDGNRDAVTIHANSDAAIVSGLIALLIRVYSGASAKTILATKPFFIEEIGLSDHLSPTRANGLHAMLNAIKGSAQAALRDQ